MPVVVQPGFVIEPAAGVRVGIGDYRAPNAAAAKTLPFPQATFGLARRDSRCSRADPSATRPVRLAGLQRAGARTTAQAARLVFKDQSALYPVSRRMRTEFLGYSMVFRPASPA
jgi:hypothetical protein